MAAFILPVYIVLLLVGGLMGYLKAGSKVSLVTSVAFALALILFGYAPVLYGREIVIGLQVVLLIVFALRLAKTRKFMPAGLMVAVTLVVLVLEWVLRPAAGS